MEGLINKLSKFKAADDSAKEMEETIKEAIEQLQEKDKIINLIAEEYSLEANTDVLDICACCNHNNEDCHGDYCKEALIEYFTKKAREV